MFPSSENYNKERNAKPPTIPTKVAFKNITNENVNSNNRIEK